MHLQLQLLLVVLEQLQQQQVQIVEKEPKLVIHLIIVQQLIVVQVDRLVQQVHALQLLLTVLLVVEQEPILVIAKDIQNLQQVKLQAVDQVVLLRQAEQILHITLRILEVDHQVHVLIRPHEIVAQLDLILLQRVRLEAQVVHAAVTVQRVILHQARQKAVIAQQVLQEAVLPLLRVPIVLQALHQEALIHHLEVVPHQEVPHHLLEVVHHLVQVVHQVEEADIDN